jgi:ligand-binding sensor domain-containing protein
MSNIENNKITILRNVMLFILSVQITSCTGQVKDETEKNESATEVHTQPQSPGRSTIFPQIHTNLNGMVSEFVRTMYQDKKGNYWFGSNGNGIIRYDGQKLEEMTIEGINPYMRVIEMVEDETGNMWFGTSEGLIKYDGTRFTRFSKNEGLLGEVEEIWGLTIDKNGLMWVGGYAGVFHFDGKKFTPFVLPDTKVDNPKPMLSDKLVFKFLEDRHGTMWLATDGNGIFKYNNGEFLHVTAENGLTDNNVADLFEDKQGNIWIGTFYGGVSKFDGTTYTNFTKDGIIEGVEAYNFLEDSKGNMWFTAEGYGVYRYDGNNFQQFTTEDGLTSNVTQSILEDKKGQLWFGSWQGLCMYDGEKFVNAKDKEPWTN